MDEVPWGGEEPLVETALALADEICRFRRSSNRWLDLSRTYRPEGTAYLGVVDGAKEELQIRTRLIADTGEVYELDMCPSVEHVRDAIRRAERYVGNVD